MERIHILISGRVQGVFFRQSTKRKADELDIVGWIRNLPNGRVELVAEGDGKKLALFIDYCKKGPDYADVTNISVLKESYSGKFSSFNIF